MPNGCGIGGDAFWLVWDEAAGEQVALNGSGRAPAAVDAEALRAGGLTRIPLRGPLGDHGPGRGPLLGRRAPALGPAVARRGAGRGDRAGRGRVPGLGRAGSAGSRRPARRLARRAVGTRVPRGLAAGRPRVAPRRAGAAPGARRDAPHARRPRGSTPTTTATSPSGSRPASRRPAGPTPSRTSAGDAVNVGDADRDDVPRRPGHDPPAQQQRRRRARDPQRPRALRAAGRRAVHRPRLVGRRRGSTSSSRPPSSRSRTATRTSPTRRSATSPWSTCSSAEPCRGARRPHRPPPRRPGADARPDARRRHDLAGRRGRRGQRGQPDPVERGRVRVGRAGPGDRDPLPEPRRVVLARPGAPQRPRARQAAGPLAAARDAVPRAASGGRGSSRGRWAATTSPRSTPSWCRRWSTAGPTSRRRSRPRGSSCEPDGSLAPPVGDRRGRRAGDGRRRRGCSAAGPPPRVDGLRRQPGPRARDRAGRRRTGRRRDRSPRPPTPAAPGFPRSAEHGSAWPVGILPQPVAAALTPVLPPASCAERRATVTSNVGQNYPYTSETEAERASRRRHARRGSRGPRRQAQGRDHAARPERPLVGMEVPDPRLPRPAPRGRLRVREARRLHRLRRHLREDVPALTAGPPG